MTISRAEYERTPRRRGYKRYWRNRKNSNRHADAAEVELQKSFKSLALAVEALKEMEKV